MPYDPALKKLPPASHPCCLPAVIINQTKGAADTPGWRRSRPSATWADVTPCRAATFCTSAAIAGLRSDARPGIVAARLEVPPPQSPPKVIVPRRISETPSPLRAKLF